MPIGARAAVRKVTRGSSLEEGTAMEVWSRGIVVVVDLGVVGGGLFRLMEEGLRNWVWMEDLGDIYL